MAQMLSFPEKWIAASRLPSGERLILKIPSCTGTVCVVSTNDLWIERAFRIKTVLGKFACYTSSSSWAAQDCQSHTQLAALPHEGQHCFLASFLPTLQLQFTFCSRPHMCKHQKCIPRPVSKISQFYSSALKNYEFLEIYTHTWE